MLGDSGLQEYGIQSLRSGKDGTQKILIANKLYCRLMATKPRAVIALKLPILKSTSFNLQQITFIRGLANTHNCPLVLFDLETNQDRAWQEKRLKNHRQLAKSLASNYHELAHYLPNEECDVIKDRERYYQPLFTAVGLAVAYLKIVKDGNQSSSQKPIDSRL